ncbi:hypothetical protein HN51_050076 [Arachis hypogaea]
MISVELSFAQSATENTTVHVVTKELIHQGMRMLKYLPVNIVKSVITFVANIKFGDLSQFGIRRPNKGPFYLKEAASRSPILDVGTIAKIKDGAIKVIPSHIMRIENKVIFGNNTEKEFDAIVFATGYKSVANKWLKDNEDGMPKNAFPKPFTLKTDREVNSSVKLHRLHYLLYKALPVLRHIHRKQSLELDIESKIRGEQLQEKGIARTALDKRERLYLYILQTMDYLKSEDEFVIQTRCPMVMRHFRDDLRLV